MKKLSDERIKTIAKNVIAIEICDRSWLMDFARAIEAEVLAGASEPINQCDCCQRVPEGYALIEKTFVPDAVLADGISVLEMCRRNGFNDRTTVITLFDTMTLKADCSAEFTPPASEGQK